MLAAVSFLFVPTASPESLAPDVVAKVNGTAISKTQLDRAMRRSGLPDSARLRTAIKNQLIARELFRQAAESKHLGNRPEVKRAATGARDDAEIRIYLHDAIKPRPVTQKEVRAKYDALVGSLGKNEYKARIIRVADAATAHKVLALLKAGTSFDALARQYSDAPNRVRGGEIHWVSFKTPLLKGKTQDIPLPVARAIVHQPEGSVSARPIVWNGERYLIKIDQVRPTQIPEFSKIAPRLKRMLKQVELQRATAQLVVKLMKHAKIEQ
ncbi:MAG TPA: peptidylprolyl isomerase [Burkholderiales bacterium]|nr:peptidylprolyl isomerase [Burkholderiales bacterium]